MFPTTEQEGDQDSQCQGHKADQNSWYEGRQGKKNRGFRGAPFNIFSFKKKLFTVPEEIKCVICLLLQNFLGWWKFSVSVCSIWQPSAKCAYRALKMWLSANEELNFKYDFISINLHLKILVWLETSTLDSTILEPTFCTYSLCILFLDKWNKGSLESLPMF